LLAFDLKSLGARVGLATMSNRRLAAVLAIAARLPSPIVPSKKPTHQNTLMIYDDNRFIQKWQSALFCRVWHS
jgi:hypothetical protein